MIFFTTNIKIHKQSEEKVENYSFRDLLKTSWMRSAIILAIIATIVGLAIILVFHVFDLSDSQFMVNLEEMFLSYGLYGIFIATIIAGTIIPLGSPALVAAAALFGVNPIALIIVSSSGFTLGMLINYFLAFKLGSPYIEKKMTKNELNEMTFVWKKWGWIIYIIFGAIPVLPVELLSFICGFLKTKILTFTILTFFPRLFVFSVLVYFGQSAGIWLGIT
jgi:membrane protein YqaA with SNARE-associated domain